MTAPSQPLTRRLLPRQDDADLRLAVLNWKTAQGSLGSDYSAAGDDLTPINGPVAERAGCHFTAASTQYLWRAEADWNIGDNVGTISAWIKLDSIGTDQVIFSTADDGSLQFYFYVSINSLNHLQFRQRDGVVTNIITGTDTTFVASRWYHVAIVSTGSQYLMYVDGGVESFRLDAGADNGDWLSDVVNRDNVTIGARHFSGTPSLFWNGTILDTRVYGRTLTADEIKKMYQQGVPDDSLVGHWFDSGVDKSRFGLDLAPQADAIVGHDIELDGTGDYLYRGDARAADWRSGDSAGVIMAWIKRDAVGVNHTIFGSGDEATNAWYFNWYVRDTNYLSLYLNKTAGLDCRSTTTPILAGQWYHVALVSTGTAYRMFVNGVEQALSFSLGTDNGDWFSSVLNRDNVTLGVYRRLAGAINFFDGSIRDVKVFSETKAAAEIKQYYLRTRGYF